MRIHWRQNIRQLIEYGRDAFHKNNKLVLKFEVWNKEEWDFVDQCMDACPNIPYFKTRICL